MAVLPDALALVDDDGRDGFDFFLEALDVA